MINYDNTWPWVCFSSEFDELQITATSPITLTIASASGLLLQNKYTPISNKVSVYDLDRLLATSDSDMLAQYEFAVSGQGAKRVLILRSGTKLTMSGADFVAGHFLSPVMGERTTTLNRREMVTVLLDTSADIVASCVYADGTTLSTVDIVLASDVPAQSLQEVDCSPSLLVDESKGRLVQYVVKAGNRRMLYRVRPTCATRLGMLFRNDFSVWEPAYFTGMNEHTQKITREQAAIGTIMTTYDIHEEDSVKSYTGPLRPSEVELFRSLARSTEVMLIENGAVTDPVVIDDVSVKHTDEEGHLPAFTFTWHRASLRTVTTVPITPRIFDETFDDTFE